MCCWREESRRGWEKTQYVRGELWIVTLDNGRYREYYIGGEMEGINIGESGLRLRDGNGVGMEEVRGWTIFIGNIDGGVDMHIIMDCNKYIVFKVVLNQIVR